MKPRKPIKRTALKRKPSDLALAAFRAGKNILNCVTSSESKRLAHQRKTKALQLKRAMEYYEAREAEWRASGGPYGAKFAPLKRRKPIKKVGKRGVKGIEDRRGARATYVREFNEEIYGHAKCQSCQRLIGYPESCFSHKLPRGRKAGNEPARGLFSCWPCNGFADSDIEYRNVLIASKANMNNGLAVKWTPKQREALDNYLARSW